MKTQFHSPADSIRLANALAAPRARSARLWSTLGCAARLLPLLTTNPILVIALFAIAAANAIAQPTITTQPQSQTNVVGTDASFTVVATGTEPLAYQWQFNSSDLAAKTNDTLIVTNLQTANAGSYAVVVTDVTGAVTSVVATLTVLVPPTITKQPTNKSVSLGANATFSVLTAGTLPRFFQWRFNETNLIGKTSTSLIVTNVQLTNAGGYTVVVTNVAGSVTSQVATLTVDTNFTKITTGPIATEGGKSTACAWGDYNKDGLLDLYVNNRDQQNFLYRNMGGGMFEKITAGHMVTNITTHLAGVWGDYDNDGDLDMLLVNGGALTVAQNNLYHNNGDGSFSQPAAAAVGSIVTDAGGFHGAAWGDVGGDGFLDVFVANYTGSNYLYRNVGGTNFTRIGGLGSTGAEGAWADYNNDGALDLLIIDHKNIRNLLYRNDGHGALTHLITEGGGAAGASWGDFNNDGFFDVFVSNWPAGRDLLYRNKGDGTFEKITQSPPVNESADTYGAAWGDYDNDGFLDLFVACGFYGNGGLDNYVFHNKGDGTFEKVLTGSLANDQGHSIGCAWADYDNDGFLDLFVANDPNFDAPGTSEINFLYRNNGNSNNWLKVRLVGTVSNRGGIGAKVRVKANYAGEDRWQLRQIASSDGRIGGSLEAHFGLGDATIIDTLRIEWPSGIVQELQGVSVKQHLTITEPAQLQALGAGVIRIQSWKGMAFEVQTSTNLDQWSPLTTVTNLTGTLEFTDPDAANHLQRFYRTVLR